MLRKEVQFDKQKLRIAELEKCLEEKTLLYENLKSKFITTNTQYKILKESFGNPNNRKFLYII